MPPVFALEKLTVRFDTKAGEVAAVSDVSFAIQPGECVAQNCLFKTFLEGIPHTVIDEFGAVFK